VRILWIKVGGLFPVHTGGRRRSYEIVSELAKRHPVVLLTTHGPGDDPSSLAGAFADCESVASVPHAIPKQGSARFAGALARSWFSALPVDLLRCRSTALRRRVRAELKRGRFDVVVADFLAAESNLPEERPPVVLFEHNVEHRIWQRMRDAERRPWRRALLEIEWRKLRRCEARACARSDRTVAVSDVDRVQLAALADGADVVAVDTGVDTTYFAPRGYPERAHELVFTGAMDWFPNEDAILRFLETTLPLIRRAVRDASLTVAGRNPTARLRAAAARAGVRVTGTVDDVRPYLARAAVVVVPLRIGGGTRLKIFEALAMGKAVVSTAVGAEGLPTTPGEHLLVADEPDPFAAAVVALLSDPARREALGAAGRRLVESRFSWPQVARRFERHLQEVIDHAR
jgi:glycosyltransferase involved in cell wall biosynthesis